MGTESKTARRIAIVSGKGGVGKTVITANLAAKLSRSGQRTLIVDADLGLANLDILLGLSPQCTLLDAVHGRCSPDEVLIHTDKGFDLLPAGSGLPEGAAFTQVLSDSMRSILQTVEDRYDIILFDAGAGVGDVVVFFAGLSNQIMLIVTPEPTSLMDAYATIKILNQIHGKDEFLVVVNQADPESLNQIASTIVGHLKNVAARFLDSRQGKSVRIDLIGSIPLDPAIPRAIRQRQLLAEACPDAPSTFGICSLADLLGARIAC
jgi:flagellar biosynthesis protein FlhG